ncbi:MAG: heme exporter protein CcmD [Actinomycetota bacterium]|nr:heme exporter protein CcmD [Actinomycetota bacterium]
MTYAGYVFAGWGVTVGVLALYTFRTLLRGRRLGAEVPEEDRRWM